MEVVSGVAIGVVSGVVVGVISGVKEEFCKLFEFDKLVFSITFTDIALMTITVEAITIG
ncbi:hypothetical protein [Dendronalium sp. ChiSLP03b]|uniref:hypothetical protein n=1 Tax=Dendronalium sp. ChiSLP03b TaxID=3075381 RepID=UPI00391D86F0